MFAYAAHGYISALSPRMPQTQISEGEDSNITHNHGDSAEMTSIMQRP